MPYRPLKNRVILAAVSFLLVSPAYSIHPQNIGRDEHRAYPQYNTQHSGPEQSVGNGESAHYSGDEPTDQTQNNPPSVNNLFFIDWFMRNLHKDPPAQWIMAGTSIIAVLLLAGTFAQTRRTVKLTREMNEIARSGHMVQNRAWLSIDNFNIVFYSAHSVPGHSSASYWIWCTIYYTIRNNGHTPALNVVNNLSAYDEVVPAFDVRIKEFESGLIDESSKGAGRSVPPNSEIHEESVALVEVRKTQAAKLVINIVIGVSYNTIFKNETRITTQSFCIFGRQDQHNATPTTLDITSIQQNTGHIIVKRMGASRMT